MEIISLKEIPKNLKIVLLKELGFNVSEDGFVIDKKEDYVIDRYTEEKISIDNMAILSTNSGILILDCNELSMASYLEFYGDEKRINKVQSMKFTQAHELVEQTMKLRSMLKDFVHWIYRYASRELVHKMLALSDFVNEEDCEDAFLKLIEEDQKRGV